MGTPREPPSSESRPGWMPEAIALFFTLLGLGTSIHLSLRSDGFHQDDDITHYRFAVNAWDDPKVNWHWWARPGYNIPTMFVARTFGLFGCRVFSSLQTAATAYLAYRIARRVGPAGRSYALVAAFAPALVWAQPMALTLSVTTLTETPAALYLTLGAWLFLRGNHVPGCAVWSLLFITRPETLPLALLPAAWIAREAARRGGRGALGALQSGWAWACAGAMVWAILLWVVVSEVTGLPVGASPLGVFHRAYDPQYGHGEWMTFAWLWLLAAGGGVLALGTAGTLFLGRRAWLVWGLSAGLVLVQTLIYRYGLFASGGYPRFLVPACGLVGALAAAGLCAVVEGRRTAALAVLLVLWAGGHAMLTRTPDPHWMLRPAVFWIAAGIALIALAARTDAARRLAGRLAGGLALLGVAGQVGAIVSPLHITDSPMNTAVWSVVNEVNRKHPGLATNPAITTHVLVPFLRGHTDTVQNAECAIADWQAAGPGTLFYWDSKYGGKPTPEHPVSPLFSALLARGRILASDSVCGFDAWVFLRQPDRPAKVPATAATASRPAS